MWGKKTKVVKYIFQVPLSFNLCKYMKNGHNKYLIFHMGKQTLEVIIYPCELNKYLTRILLILIIKGVGLIYQNNLLCIFFNH